MWALLFALALTSPSPQTAAAPQGATPASSLHVATAPHAAAPLKPVDNAQSDAGVPQAGGGQSAAGQVGGPQGKPAAAPAQTPEAPDAQEQATPQPRALPPIHVDLPPITLGLGLSQWNLFGDDHKFREYATPPRGLFIDEILLAPKPSSRNYGFLDLRGLGEIDYRYGSALYLNHGWTHLEGAFWHNEFFDPTPVVIPTSHWGTQNGDVEQLITRTFGLSLHYRMTNQVQWFQPPAPQLNQRERYWDVVAAGKLGNGQVRVGYTDWRYFDRTNTYLDTAVTGARVGYTWTPVLWAGLEFDYANLWIKQPGLLANHADIVTVGGNTSLGANSDVAVLVERERMQQPLTQTAYAQAQRRAAIALSHNWGTWSARLGFTERDMERVRADQSFVDVPEWITFDGRLQGRLNKDVRLMLRGYTEHLSHIPPAIAADPVQLYWNARQFIQAKVERGTPDLNAYFEWTYRNWDNYSTVTSLNLNSFVVGLNWQATPAISLFGEYTKENWNGSSPIATFPTFQNFLPDSDVVMAGLNWVFNPRLYLSVVVTDFGTANDNPLLLANGNTHGQFFTVTSRYLFPSGSEISLVVAPWSYSDAVTSVTDYHSTMVMLTGKTRF